MKAAQCPSLEKLAELGRLPRGDAGRAHLDGCARCQAQLLALDEFTTSAESDLPGHEWRDVESELLSRRERDGLVASERTRVTPLRRVWRLPALRPVLGAAAALAVVMVAWMVMRPADDPVMRNIEPGGWQPTIATSDGAVTLRWDAVPEADGYRIQFFDGTLQPVASLATGQARTARLDAGSLPAGLPSRQAVVVQIVALRGEDSLATSQAVSLRLP
jgi:hypothetical protein